MLPEIVTQEPWVATALVAVAAVLVALVAHRLLRAVLHRAATGFPMVHAIIDAATRPASAVVPLAALQAVWQGAPDNLRYIASVRHVNGVLLIGALTWLVIGAIRGLADGVVARHPVDVADNLQARRIQTQARVLARSGMVLVLLAGTAMALMTFPGARQLGASLLASAGVVGIVAGIAARPVFSNLIAGLQLALAQPLRLDDILIVKGEFGHVEEITGTYVVLKLWDERRLIIPLQWFIENPFENWTRSSSQLTGTVFLNLDFSAPLDVLRAELESIVRTAPDWDRRVCGLQVTDATERTMQVRILVSASSASQVFDLRCLVREKLVDFLQRQYPHALPQLRVEERMADAEEIDTAPRT